MKAELSDERHPTSDRYAPASDDIRNSPGAPCSSGPLTWLRALALPCAMVSIWLVSGCADEPTVSEDSAASTASNQAESAPPGDTEPPPEIEARLYRVKTVKMGNSSTVYLLDRLAASPPPAGSGYAGIPAERKLLVLKHGDDNVMAMRVLKDLPDTNQLIVKKIRQYNNTVTLPLGEQYVAVEKVSDAMPPPPTEQDQKDMQELSPPLAYDPELDAGSSPAPGEKAEDAAEPPHDDDDDQILGRAIEDTEMNDTHRNWLSAEIGLLRNTPNGANTFSLYAAGGLRYGYSLLQHIFFDGGDKYDTLSLEGGAFFYKIVNIYGNSQGGDSYTIMPLIGTVRYTVFMGEDFGLSFYGGVMRNIVTGTVPPTGVAATDPTYQQIVSNLGLILPAFGMGAVFRIGPGWYLRADLGTEGVTAGVALRF
jgi:hypothetical protein